MNIFPIMSTLCKLLLPENIFRGSWVYNKFLSHCIRKAYVSLLNRDVLNLNSFVYTKGEEYDFVISLTSYPDREADLRITLSSIFRQTKISPLVVLWLAETQYDEDGVPAFINKFRDLGLIVRFVPDWRSHKKYLQCMMEFSELPIITLDDDVIYPEDHVSKLWTKMKMFPNCIVAYRCHELKFDKDGTLLPYHLWSFASPGLVGPSNALFPVGVGGVGYRRELLHRDVTNFKAAIDNCPTADDVYLNAMSRLMGTRTIKVGRFSRPLVEATIGEESALSKVNVVDGANDVQIRNMRHKYGLEYSNEKA